jgi:DNA repair protein RadC
VGNYLLKQFIGITTEIFILLLMDNAGKVLFCDKIFDGSITAVDVNTRKIIELCLKYNATAAVISHNHPRGNALPSKEDIVSTNELKSALKVIAVNLLDHMIISGNEFCSLAEIDGLFE